MAITYKAIAHIYRTRAVANTTRMMLCQRIMERSVTIEMKKIGSILDSRPAGREALLAMRPYLKNERKIFIGFAGVIMLTPSFADEFVTLIVENDDYDVTTLNTKDNITVEKTLAFLSDDWFKKVVME